MSTKETSGQQAALNETDKVPSEGAPNAYHNCKLSLDGTVCSDTHHKVISGQPLVYACKVGERLRYQGAFRMEVICGGS